MSFVVENSHAEDGASSSNEELCFVSPADCEMSLLMQAEEDASSDEDEGYAGPGSSEEYNSDL